MTLVRKVALWIALIVSVPSSALSAEFNYFGAEDPVEIKQSSKTNIAVMTFDGSADAAVIIQQNGASNSSNVQQKTNWNTSVILQSGWRNTAVVYQEGPYSGSVIAQQGPINEPVTLSNRTNWSLTPRAGGYLSLFESGDVSIAVLSSSNLTWVSQFGRGR